MFSLQRLPAQGARYAQTFIWLLRGSFRVAPVQWRRVVVATLFFLGGNAAMVGAIFLYVRLLESNATLNLPGLTLVPRESLLLLALFAGSILFSLAVIAGSQYVARTAALRLFRRYQEALTRRILHLLLRLPDPCAAEATELTAQTDLRRYYTEFARSCGWSTRFIANAFPALMLFAMALLGLLWLDAGVTLLVVLLGLVLIAAQYPASLFAAHASYVLDAAREQHSQRLGHLVRQVDGTKPGESEQRTAAAIDEFFDTPQIKVYQTANENRYKALELSALSMQLGGAFALAFVLIAIVRDLFENGGEWATVAAYATLLRQLLANATNIFRAVTVFSRLTPHISAFRAFVMAADQAGKCIPPPMPDSLRIQAKEMNGSATTTLLARGTCFRIMTATPFGRGVAMDLQRALLAANARAGGERTQAPRIPAIGTFSAADALLGKTGDLERQLVGAVTDHQGILLLPEPQYAQLSDSGRSRLLEHAAHVALGLVSKPSRAQIAAGSLLLICDRSTTWHWLRVPVSGLTASTRRDIEKLAKQGDRKAKAMADLDEIG